MTWVWRIIVSSSRFRITWRELRAFLYLIFAVVIVIVLWYFLHHNSPWLLKNENRVEMVDADGLKESAPVLCSGVNCGRVLSITRKDQKANILIGLHKGVKLYNELVPRVVTIGFVGQRALELGFYELKEYPKTELEIGVALKGEKPRGPASFGPSVAAFYEVFQADLKILKVAYAELDKDKFDTLLTVLSVDLPKSIKKTKKILRFSNSEITETLSNINELKIQVTELQGQLNSFTTKVNESPMFATLENIQLNMGEITEKLEMLKASYVNSDLNKIINNDEVQKETQEALKYIQEIGVILKEQKVRLMVDFF